MTTSPAMFIAALMSGSPVLYTSHNCVNLSQWSDKDRPARHQLESRPPVYAAKYRPVTLDPMVHSIQSPWLSYQCDVIHF
jgi:hypothetical protein